MTSTNKALALLPTGVPGFDEILGGGLPERRIFLVTGSPGSGKTTFGLQFLLEGARRGERCFYVTLSESEEECRGVALSHGWNLDGVVIRDLSVIESQLADELENSLFNAADVELRETTKPILDEIARERPHRVVFDSLSELRSLAGSVHRFRRRVLALKQHLVGLGCTTLLVDDGAGENGDEKHVASLVHGVIEIQQKPQEYGKERRHVRIVKMRGQKVVGGCHDFDIVKGGAHVYPRLTAAEHHATFDQSEVLKSGLAGLDALLGGGPQRGTSTLLVGPAGCGKSSIASLYANAAAQRGEHAAMFTFEETRAVLLARCRGLGLPLDEHVRTGKIALTQIDPAEMAPAEFIHSVRRSVEKYDARVVVVDSLNGFLNSMPEERHLSLQLHELLTYLSQKGIATFLVMAQHGLVGSSMHSPVDVSYLADNVVMLRYFEAGGRVRKALSIVKKRAGAHESTIRELKVSPGTIAIGEPLDEFHGVLTGVPIFSGHARDLMQDKAN